MDKILKSDTASGLFNVSTGEGHSIYDVFCAVSQFLKKEISDISVLPTGSDDIQKVVLDPTKTENAFGWKANVSFNQIITNQLQWYNDNGIDEVFSHLKPK